MKLYAHISIFKILYFNVTYSPVTGTFIFLFGQLETVRPKKLQYCETNTAALILL